MPRRRSSPANPSAAPIDSVAAFTQERGLALWRESAKRVEGSRARMLAAEDLSLGRTQITPPRHLRSSTPSALIPTLAARKTLVLNMTNLLAENRPIIERNRPPKGGPATETRAEETETALNALLLELFPWDPCAGRSVQHAEYTVATLLAEDAWDASPEYDDVLSEEDWKKLPEKEKRTYRKAEATDQPDRYQRPKQVYWRDSDGKGVESDDYGRRDPAKTKKAYQDALSDHLASKPPFVIRGYSAFDTAPVWDSTGLVACCIRQLMEPSDLLARGYRCKGLDLGEDGEARVLVPPGFDGGLWGKAGKLWLYQFFLWIKGDPHIVYMVGGQTTTVQDGDKQVEAITNLREKWGFTRLPVGVYYGNHLQTDNADDKPVPFMEPIGPALLAAEGLLGAVNITAWRRGTSKYTITPNPNIPPSAYLDADNNLKPIDLDPDKDIVTAVGPVGHLAPLEHSGDTRYLVAELLGSVREATPSPAVSGGEGTSSGREAAVLHSYAQSSNRMIPEGLRKAYEDSASFMLEWACCFMRTKKLTEIPYYANVETDPSEGSDSQDKQTVMVRLREDWIGRNYKVTARYLPTPNPVQIEQEVSLYEKGVGSFEDVQTARGKTNPLRERIKAVNDLYWRSERGQMELSALDARQRGDVERALAYEKWLAGQAAPLAVGPDGKPIEMGPSAALDSMFQGQEGVGGSGGGPTSAQARLAGTTSAGRGAERGDAATLAGAQPPAGPVPVGVGAGMV